MTTSPRRIGIEFRNRFDPRQRLALAVRVQLGDLCRDPATDRFRACVRHYETQLAQALPPSPRAHHLHSLGGLGHIILGVHYLPNVTRYTAWTRSIAGPETIRHLRTETEPCAADVSSFC